MNNVKEKILLLLLAGIALGCSYTPGKQWFVLKTFSREWNKINKKELRKGISYLYRLGYVDKEKNDNNIFKVLLTKKGKLVALNSRLNNIKNKKEKWDGKWRMVAFDIPNKFKIDRDALRNKLKKVGFCKLQESILIIPYDCLNEISDLADYFELQKYVRFGLLEFIDNGEHFKKIFRLV